MEAKISLKKVQFFMNIAFSITFIVWIIFDLLRIIPTRITPANHLIPEGFGMFVLGLLFGSIKEPRFLWPLILGWLLASGIVGIILFRGLFTIIGINLFLVFSFLFGYFLQGSRGIVKKV